MIMRPQRASRLRSTPVSSINSRRRVVSVEYFLHRGCSAAAARKPDIGGGAPDNRGNIDRVALRRRGVGHLIGDHHRQRGPIVNQLRVKRVPAVKVDPGTGEIVGGEYRRRAVGVEAGRSERDFKMPSGGARPGAGRKAKALITVRKVMDEEILGTVDEVGLWRQLVASDDPRIRLDSLKYLTDRRDGKASQYVSADVTPVMFTLRHIGKHR